MRFTESMRVENLSSQPIPATSKERRSKDAMDEGMEKQADLTMDCAGIDQKSQRVQLLRDHGKRRIQICFRITEKAWDRLVLISRLFGMKDSDYAKAVLYKDLGVWTERLDYRRRKKR
jgi:hypothetical protein